MASKYVNPKLMEQTKSALLAYKAKYPKCATPMAGCFDLIDTPTEDDKGRFYRAAKQLGWDVCRQHNIVYENGLAVWQ